MERPRRIAILTTSRAEWGHLAWPLRRMREHAGLELLLYAGAAHVDTRFGSTLEAIRRDGFEPDEILPCLDAEDSRTGMGRTLASLATSLATCLDRDKPDLLLVMADRYEMLAPASIATAMGIPIVHIEGGELSEGALDQQVRDALTKLSHLHLVPHEQAARRVRQLGEEEWRIHVTGSPSLDHLVHSSLPDADFVSSVIGIPLDPAPLVVAVHSVTLEQDTTRDAESLMDALGSISHPIVFCFPNADDGFQRIIDMASEFCSCREDAVLHRHIEHLCFWSLLKHAAAIVGNSSCGIMESPSIGLPCVNIGDRQRGRLRSDNIIDVEPVPAMIASAINQAIDPSFRRSLVGMDSTYGDGNAGQRIAEALASCPLGEALLQKRVMEVSASIEPVQ